MRILLLIAALGIVGCGSRDRDTFLAYREAFAQGEWAKAHELLAKTGLQKEEKSRLLWLMEKGRLDYASGQLPSAIKTFTEGVELLDQQYTKSISREASKWIVNDGSGEFFGAPFERSWLHYHLALAHWRLYQEGSLPADQARLHLFSARAAILAWDTFFQEWQRGTGGKSLYRHDLAAKTVAAEVHEATGLRADLQISLQLYKDAWRLLDTLGPLYPAYNGQAVDYLDDLGKALAEEGTFTPPKKHRQETTLSEQTRRFLREKILRLTLSLRPGEITEVQKQFGFSAQDVAEAKRLQTSNVTFLLEEGVIPQKTAKEVNLGIKGAASMAKDQKTQEKIASVGAEAVGTFAVGVLGLGVGAGGSAGHYFMASKLTTFAASEAAIAFEVPTIPAGKRPESLWLVVQGEGGKEVLVRPWNLVSPLEDVARQSLDEEATQRIIRTGVRVVMKHVLAIVAAYGVYQRLHKGQGDFLAKMAAVGTYVAATKGIAYSERADTRAWVSLPRALRLTDASLPPGSYTVSLATKAEQNAPGDLRALGRIDVPTGHPAIFTYLAPQL